MVPKLRVSASMRAFGISKLLLLATMFLSSCSHVEVIEGTDKERIKVNVLLSDECKIHSKRRALLVKCKWIF